MLERDRTYNNILDRVERLEIRVEDLRDVARPAEVVTFEAPDWQALAGWVSTGTVLQDVNGRIVLDPTIPRILIDADGYIESADFVAGTSGFRIDGGTAEFNDIVIRGTIYASVGVIGGWTITATQLKAAGDVILLDSSGVITVGGAGYLQSDPFTSGTQGWRITPTEAEFENITARGEIRTAVFKYNEVHAQAGQLLVTPNAAKLDEDLTIAASGAFNVGEVGRFGGGDIVRLKDGTGDVWLTVVADIGAGFYSYTRSSGSPAGTVFRAGTAVVGYGAAGEGGIVLDALTANGPFMDIFTHAGSPWSALTTKVRVGNLAGIVDADLNPTGYGFYSDNAFLKGALIAGAGDVIINSDGVDIDFDPSAAGAAHVRFRDFDATHDGYVYWYAYSDSAAGVLATRSVLEVLGDNAAGTNTNALLIFSAKGKGQTSYQGDSGTGLKLQSWETPVGTYYGAVLGADDTIARVQSYGAAWIELQPDGDVLIRSYLAGGDVMVQLSDAVGTSQLEVLDSAGAEVAYIDSDGKALFALDAHPDSDGLGLFRRTINRLGISTYDDHFRAGVIPSGYAWQGAPFGGTPAVSYSYASDYLVATLAISTRYFLSRAVTNAAANWQNKSLYGRFNAGIYARCGVRFDDGTDNNYVQVFATGEASDGTMSVTFQYRAGGGAVTTVTSNVTVPSSEFLTLRLRMFYSAPNYTAYGYLMGETGMGSNIAGFSVAVAWAPAAGRAGVFLEDTGVSSTGATGVDWFKNEFS